MTTPNPLLAIAASTLLASLALTPSALADEPGSSFGTNAAPAAEVPARKSVAEEPPVRESPAVRIDEEGPRHRALGMAGIIAMVVGGGAIATGVGLAASDEEGAAPTAAVGATVLLSGVVMTALGYSSDSSQERDAAATRSRRPASVVDESSWEAKQASREIRRNVGIGLTIPGLAFGAGGAALIAKGLGGSGGGSSGFKVIGDEVIGGATVGLGTLLLAFGVPLWIANSGEEPRPPAVHAELGVGPGSIELRGSF
jgi:hypothetical protein